MPQKVDSRGFLRIANSVLKKGNLLYLLYSTAQRCCLQHLIKQNFSKNSNLNDSGISLPIFHSRTNLKLHNISVTCKIIKKDKANLVLSKASGPDSIPVVVLKNCDPELSYILAKLFNVCLKESCFVLSYYYLIIVLSSLVVLLVPVFKNVGERF